MYGNSARHAGDASAIHDHAMTVNVAGPAFASLDGKAKKQYPLKQGRPIFGLQVKITDDEDKALPWDGATAGHLKVKGPTVCQHYFGTTAAESATDANGWFMTGDVATIDPDGTILKSSVCCASRITGDTSEPYSFFRNRHDV